MFRVIDSRTGKSVAGLDDMRDEVAGNCGPRQWAYRLVWCDLCGWLVDQQGVLYLCDSCGNYAEAPERYKVVWDAQWLADVMYDVVMDGGFYGQAQ